MNAEEFVKAIHPILRSQRFSRTGKTWRRDQGESVAVLSVQKSPWGDGMYYVNVGMYFRAFGGDRLPTANKCHVQTRIDVAAPVDVLAEATKWFDARSTLAEAARLSALDAKRGLVFKELLDAGTMRDEART